MNQGDERLYISQEPYGLLEILQQHCLEEFGALFFYNPLYRGSSAQGVSIWLELLRANGVIRGKPWRLNPHHIPAEKRLSIPHLFEGGPTTIETYRLDRAALAKLLTQLDGPIN